MKYIITDLGEVRVGKSSVEHPDLAAGTKGKVIAAGHYEIDDDSKLKVFGRSDHYGIRSERSDGPKIARHLHIGA